jgi:hypothetical protein
MNTRIEAKPREAGERAFCRCLWILSFAVVLPIAIVAWSTRWHWRPWSPGANGYQSALREASSIADVIVGQSLNGF